MNAIWNWLKSVGTLLVALTVVGLAIVGLAMNSGLSALTNLVEAALHKDAAATASIVSLLNLALTASAVLFLLLKYAENQRLLASFADASQTGRLAFNELKSTINQLISHMKFSGGKVFFDDVPEIWSAFAGDLFIARNPTFAMEVRWTYIAGTKGQWRLSPDRDRVLVWRKRLSQRGPARIEIIFKVGVGTFSSNRTLSASAVDNVVRFLFLMRQIRREDANVDLGKIIVYLVAVQRTHQSVFIGKRPGPFGDEALGITYADSRDPLADRAVDGSSHEEVTKDPRPLIVTTDEELIERWTRGCQSYRDAADMILSVDELELLYGHLVPTHEGQIMSRLNHRDWRPDVGRLRHAAANSASIGEVIDTGDGNFYITNTPASPTSARMTDVA
ncbi:hypothetical protein PMI42_00164 [Bradyrhizobium sp. YR681]|uniref:hypothetical protein n=1 Tax=Bradyrhizobium sp. YR681 TaxID=1144344 RepID=UPI000270F579|nr:hypothetical protein [Bradyrhizobium sp. YR681]EJN16263.1 hypothetical protein PMI42_00164 [Bradyrhizobium sp. YR681]